MGLLFTGPCKEQGRDKARRPACHDRRFGFDPVGGKVILYRGVTVTVGFTKMAVSSVNNELRVNG